MYTYNLAQTLTIEAAVDLEEKRFVDRDGNYCGAGEKAKGVCMLDVSAGKQATIGTLGTAPVLTGGAITKGAPVTSDANGKAVEATALSATTPAGGTTVISTSDTPAMTISGSVTPEAINGYAEKAATGADETIVITIVPG